MLSARSLTPPAPKAMHTFEQARRIRIPGKIRLANMEAWRHILDSYQTAHPEHHVGIVYQGKLVQNLDLFKQAPNFDLEGFELSVEAPDENWDDVGKLYRYMLEGAGENYQSFLPRELYQTPQLF